MKSKPGKSTAWHGKWDKYESGIEKSKKVFLNNYGRDNKKAFLYLGCGLHTQQDVYAHQYHRVLNPEDKESVFKKFEKADHQKRKDNKLYDFAKGTNGKYKWIKRASAMQNSRYRGAYDKSVELLEYFAKTIILKNTLQKPSVLPK